MYISAGAIFYQCSIIVKIFILLYVVCFAVDVNRKVVLLKFDLM